jgi:uncharacterized protein (TIGR02466 family)
MADETNGKAPEAAMELVKKSSDMLFASPVDLYQLSEPAAFNRQLAEDIVRWRASTKGMNKSNLGGWHSSKTIFSRPEPAIRQLCIIIRAALAQSIKRYWPEFLLDRHELVVEAWANVNGPGAMNMLHNHPNSHLSGCYYVATPETDEPMSGSLEFINPSGMHMQGGQFGSRLSQMRRQYDPTAGMLVIFPSYLGHIVLPNRSQEDRISVAFNASVTSKPLKAT